MFQQTIIDLNPRSSTAWQLIQEPDRVHHTVRLINPSQQRVLWRLHGTQLALRHREPLNWQALERDGRLLGEHRSASPSFMFERGTELHFNVLAYIRRRPRTGSWIVQRPPAYLEWLQRCASDHGFQALDVQALTQISYLVRTSSLSLRLQPVELMGRLRVNAPETFAQTMTDGLGRMRAYGCGLVLLKDARVQF